MTTLERLKAALQHLVDIDQETLSVSLVGDHTEDECYNEARIWLERAISCHGAPVDHADEDESYPPPCSDPGGHVWPNVEEHERCLCVHCGADGDA